MSKHDVGKSTSISAWLPDEEKPYSYGFKACLPDQSIDKMVCVDAGYYNKSGVGIGMVGGEIYQTYTHTENPFEQDWDNDLGRCKFTVKKDPENGSSMAEMGS